MAEMLAGVIWPGAIGASVPRRGRGRAATLAIVKGDRVEAVVDTGQGTQTFVIEATRAGRRLEVATSRGVVEVSEVTRSGTPVRTGRFMASRSSPWSSSRPTRDANHRSRCPPADGSRPWARTDTAAPALAVGTTGPSDLVLTGGRVETITPREAPADAVAVTDGRISAVGTAADVDGLIGPSTRVIHLSGETVLPGFQDAHCHAVYGGPRERRVHAP